MVLTDAVNAYGPVSRINHWLGALLVLVLLGIGLYFHEMPRGDERMFWLRLHVALGTLALLPLLFRVGWRLAVRAPAPLSQPPALQRFTRVIHGLLLLSLTLLLVSGPLIVWSMGAPVGVFEWFALPSPMTKNPGLHAILEQAHALAGKAILWLVALHVFGAVKHAVWDGDGKRRMWGRPSALPGRDGGD